VLLCGSLASACKIASNDSHALAKVDTTQVRDQIDNTVDQARNVEICPGYTVEQLLQADSLSSECRQALLSFLPMPENSFKSRLVSPGGAHLQGGQVRALLQAADGQGHALAASALAQLEVRVVEDGVERALTSDDYTWALPEDLPQDLLSIAVVNDYSASMTEGDLDDVASVERGLFDCLPKIHETEVIRFSTEVSHVLPFTSDAVALDLALARDDKFERKTTALFDALGTALDDLDASPRPVHVVVLATDGRENASTMVMKPQVFAALSDPKNFIVVFGALLADVDLMRELAAKSGVFFYTREFQSILASVQPYCESLAGLSELRIPVSGDIPPEAVRLHHPDLKLDLRLEIQ
jgi:hypothetical protein